MSQTCCKDGMYSKILCSMQHDWSSYSICILQWCQTSLQPDPYHKTHMYAGMLTLSLQRRLPHLYAPCGSGWLMNTCILASERMGSESWTVSWAWPEILALWIEILVGNLELAVCTILITKPASYQVVWKQSTGYYWPTYILKLWHSWKHKDLSTAFCFLPQQPIADIGRFTMQKSLYEQSTTFRNVGLLLSSLLTTYFPSHQIFRISCRGICYVQIPHRSKWYGGK